MDEKETAAHRLIYGLSAQGIALADAVQGYLLSCELENRAPTTVQWYRGLLTRFEWYVTKNNLPAILADINSGHIRMFLDYVKSNPTRWADPDHPTANRRAKPVTVVRYRACLHAFWAWCVGEEMLATNPVTRIRPPKVEKLIPRSLSEDEIKKLVSVCREDKISPVAVRDLAIILVLLDTGIRASELCGLKLGDWDKSRRIKVFGKGRKERWAALSPFTAKCLWDYCAKHRMQSPYEEVFLNVKGTPLSISGVEDVVERRGRQAGLGHVYPHLLRHTFALTWCREGGPLSGLQTLLGHSTPNMSLWYGQMSSEQATDLHKQFSPVEKLGLRFKDKK